MSKRAFITGITGQDGSYLSELLLAKGYEVHGLLRRSSSLATTRIDHIYKDLHEPDVRLFLHYGDVTDGAHLISLLRRIAPHEVYNLAAQSHVRVSFDEPMYTANVDAIGALNVLEAVRQMDEPARFYQASSSEMFGLVHDSPQNEATPFHPRSPYACAKAYAHYQTVNYREAYGIFACGGILFNHESPRRGETFVTRKITRAAVRIKRGLQDRLYLGNLDSKRDWGYAAEYVEAMWLMLQQSEADDYVIATGQAHSVREFLEAVFSYLDLDWRDYVEIDARYQRPSEVDFLLGDASKAGKCLGWKPSHTFSDLVKLMVDADMKALDKAGA